MNAFIFMPSSSVHVQDYLEWGFDDSTSFQQNIINYFGSEIVSVKKEMDGYYDIVFEDGHKLYSISELYIDKREV